MATARPLRLLGVIAAALGAGVIAAACASPRNALGPTESGCYQAIPIARAIAGHDARFAGVRYLSAGEIEKAVNVRRSALVDVIDLPRPAPHASCVVAFQGHFSGVDDKHAFGPSSGSYLIVVVSLAPEHELAALVVTSPPLRLTRLLPTTHQGP